MDEDLIELEEGVILEALSDIEQNYHEFLEHSDSFLGWMLTLNDFEFEYVHKNLNHDFKNDPENGKSFLFTHLEAIKSGRNSILFRELIEDLKVKIIGSHLIKAARSGLATYETAPKDADWVFDKKVN